MTAPLIAGLRLEPGIRRQVHLDEQCDDYNLPHIPPEFVSTSICPAMEESRGKPA